MRREGGGGGGFGGLGGGGLGGLGGGIGQILVMAARLAAWNLTGKPRKRHSATRQSRTESHRREEAAGSFRGSLAAKGNR
jgi:hypothetical protein